VKEVFLIGIAKFVEQDTWLVRGVAYELIKVGDTVFVVSPPLSFKVIAISTYRRNIDALYPMMTGDLTLYGEQGEALKDSKKLMANS
jgi:hypothetical protein